MVIDGLEKYKTNINEIDKEIVNGVHFNEDSDFLRVLFDSLLTSASSELSKLKHSSGKQRRRRSKSRTRSRDRKRRKEVSRRDSRSRSSSISRRKRKKRSWSRSPERNQGRPGEKDLRDKIGRRKRVHSRSRSRSKSLVITVRRSRSPSPCKPVSKRSDDRVSETQKKNSSKDHGNIVNLSDEDFNRLQESLMKEKKQFLAKPNDHPEYQSRWRKFWSRKQKLHGPKNQDVNQLIPEWTAEWRAFLDDEFQRKLSAKDPRKIASVRSEGKAELVTLSGESDDEIKYQPPISEHVSSNNTPSTSRILPTSNSRVQSPCQAKSESSNLVKLERFEVLKTYQVPKEDFSVLSLINILSSLNSKGLMMEDLGSKLQKIKSLALSLEEKSHGDSKLLVDEKECFNFVDQCQETLKQKLRSGLVAESHKRTVQIGLDLIEMFFAQSSCQRSEVLEVACFSPLTSEDEPVTKIKIAEAIEAELHGCSKRITQEEFNSLVEAEFIRVRNKINPKIVNPCPQQHYVKSSASGASNPQHFSAYTNPPTVSGIQRIEQQPRVDWDSIIKALQVAKHQSSTPNVNLERGSNSQQSIVRPQSSSDQLSEDEIVALVKNIHQLPSDSKQELLEYMKQIELLDPMKAYRIKQKVKEKY